MFLNFASRAFKVLIQFRLIGHIQALRWCYDPALPAMASYIDIGLQKYLTQIGRCSKTIQCNLVCPEFTSAKNSNNIFKIGGCKKRAFIARLFVKGGGLLRPLSPDRKQMWKFWIILAFKFDSLILKTNFISLWGVSKICMPFFLYFFLAFYASAIPLTGF